MKNTPKQTPKIQLTTTHTPEKILKNEFPVMRLLQSWPTASWMLVHTRWVDRSVFNKGVLTIALCKNTPVQFTCTHCVWKWAARARMCMWILDRKQNWNARKMGLLPFYCSLLTWPLLFLIIVHLWHAHGVPGILWPHAVDIFPSCTFIWICLQDFFLNRWSALHSNSLVK